MNTDGFFFIEKIISNIKDLLLLEHPLVSSRNFFTKKALVKYSNACHKSKSLVL